MGRATEKQVDYIKRIAHRMQRKGIYLSGETKRKVDNVKTLELFEASELIAKLNKMEDDNGSIRPLYYTR